MTSLLDPALLEEFGLVENPNYEREKAAKRKAKLWKKTPRARRLQYAATYRRKHRKERADAARKYYWAKGKKQRRIRYKDPVERAKIIETQRRWKRAHPELVREYNKRYERLNREKIRRRVRMAMARGCRQLSDYYVRHAINQKRVERGLSRLSAKDIPKAAIEATRLRLKIIRKLRTQEAEGRKLQ